MKQQKPIGTFEIPEELAKELDQLLIKQTIRERILLQVVDDRAKYDAAESILIPIVAKIESIKAKITDEYVPDKYRYAEYMWNYDGWEISKNVLSVFTA